MEQSTWKTGIVHGSGMTGGVALPGRKTGGRARQKVWMAWEAGVGRLMALTSECTLEAGMCKVLVKKYKGTAFVCQDGTRVEKGDRIGELHLNNRMVLELTREHGADRAAIRTARLIRASLKELAWTLDRAPELADVKALIGVTLLHRGLTHGLGFEQRALPSKAFERITTLYLKLLLRFLHPNGLGRSERSKTKLTSVQLVSTRANLRRLLRAEPDSCATRA
ncbi:YkoP family protein [Cohnella hongkongensis]|uniref:Polysaccharide deacetylase n=1 Tax=Cohnella hongkongensis TaxID=178337 RepID=A0ABV9F7E9_9BACL